MTFDSPRNAAKGAGKALVGAIGLILGAVGVTVAAPLVAALLLALCALPIVFITAVVALTLMAGGVL